MQKFKKFSAVASGFIALGMVLSACSGGGEVKQPNDQLSTQIANDDCTPLVIATSSEKVNLMEDLGQGFKKSDLAKGLAECVSVYPVNVTSGAGYNNLTHSTKEWPDTNKDLWPTVWSPASSVWTDLVAGVAGADVVAGAESFTKTPIVYGVPESMAKALNYPQKDVSLTDIEKLIVSKDGWGSVGKPLWGSFKISKTNPNTSTTGLSAILMQIYENSKKVKDLNKADVDKAASFSKSFESGAIHYGDTTGKVLTTLYENTNGAGSSYVSAIALEETSLFNYNKGNPDSHTVQPGETLTPPKEKLVAVYPKNGSMWSDNPAVVLNTDWVTENKKAAGEAFLKFLQTEDAQKVLPKYGFRPLSASVDAAADLNASVGIDLKKPTVTLPKPSAEVVSAAKNQWTEIRKPSAVLELIDISGSMDQALEEGSNVSRLDAAIDGAKGTLGNFRPSDEVCIWAFTSGIESKYGQGVVPVRECGPFGSDEGKLAGSLDDLKKAKHANTPLYDSISSSYDYMKANAQSGRINAIVVLSDGEDAKSKMDLNSLLLKLKADSNQEGGGDNAQVRIFTIAYSADADKEILNKIAQATGGQMFDATDPSRIKEVFEAVINNF